MFERIRCCRCGETFGMSSEAVATVKRSSATLHCPWGHPQYFPLGETELDVVRRERDRLKQANAMLEQEAQDAMARARDEAAKAAKAKREAKRLKTRAAGGVCPCCNRTFIGLARHMKAKHPDFPENGGNVVELHAAKA